MKSQISKVCFFTSDFHLVCLIAVFVTVGSLSALTSHVTVSHVLTSYTFYNFIFLLYNNYWLNLQRNFKSEIRFWRSSCTLWAITVALVTSGRESEVCVCVCVSGLWVERLVLVELLFLVLWFWTSVLQPDHTPTAPVPRTGVWGPVTHTSNLPGPRMWWETQCEFSAEG